MTRVIHTGDTHIGYQQYHSPARRADFLAAFEQVVDDAIAGDVDAVVHAGDLFHDRRPALQDLLGTIAALRRLADADVPFLAIVGNHEATRGGQWLDLLERLDLATRLGDDPEYVGDVAFYGLDHVPRSRRDDLEYAFAGHDATHAALVAHGLFRPFPHGDWDAAEVLCASSVAFDAMLLGDNHAPDTREVEGAWVTYCGSTERASADERQGRGYNLVTFDADAASTASRDEGAGAPASVDVRRRSLETRSFAFVSVDLAPGEGVERVREQVRQHDLDEAVVVVEVTGDGEAVTPAEIESFALDQGALVARVTDRRELAEPDADLSVSFADPDDAVRERVAEMGLSPVALDVDETIRASKTADTNVREEVRGRVAGRLDDGGAFEPAPGGDETDAGTEDDADPEPDPDTDADADDTPAGAAGGDSSAATGPADTGTSGDDAPGVESPPGDAPAAEDADVPGHESGEQPDAGPDDGSTESAEELAATAVGGDSDASDQNEADQSADAARSAGSDADDDGGSSGDDQASMEDYL